MKSIYGLGLLVVVGLGFAAAGHAAPDFAAVIHVAAGEATPASAVSGTGVIQVVKPDQGKVKINHDPIPALDWPTMSMYFRVKDKAVLEGFAAGDKVRFDLEKDAKGLAITRMEKIAK
jgi:Cu(I)/Ag(I) efflux system protein CusF